jgi:transposase
MEGYEARFAHTTTLKHQKQLDENASVKNDMRDTFTIANIVREGKYIDTIMEDGLYQQLRPLPHIWEQILRDNTSSKQVLRAVLEDCLPELKNIFWSMKAKSLWAILERDPFPENVLKIACKELREIIVRSTQRNGHTQKKAEQIYGAATTKQSLMDWL